MLGNLSAWGPWVVTDSKRWFSINLINGRDTTCHLASFSASSTFACHYLSSLMEWSGGVQSGVSKDITAKRRSDRGVQISSFSYFNFRSINRLGLHNFNQIECESDNNSENVTVFVSFISDNTVSIWELLTFAEIYQENLCLQLRDPFISDVCSICWPLLLTNGYCFVFLASQRKGFKDFAIPFKTDCHTLHRLKESSKTIVRGLMLAGYYSNCASRLV